ncbi:hypothetical protein [Desulfoscipio gibsoniae]|uniref:hypothetical protein n=1 Tax=Desulfoscipio gibsoniae TaxID=102134 RepID=UPI000308D245|nr:hypothetical protein [Desulfoscipio gibsoniae]
MQKSVKWWFIWFAFLVFSAFWVPFNLLSHLSTVYGAFLYWGVFAIAAIISVGIIAGKWRD